MIDEKKLIELLRTGYEIVHGRYLCADAHEKIGLMTEMHYIKRGMKLLDNQPKVGEWIPCSEQMPKEHDEFRDIINPITLEAETIHSTVSKLVNVTVIDLDKDESFVCDDCTVNGRWSNFESKRFEVVAWQPLPEPYQSDMTEGEK